MLVECMPSHWESREQTQASCDRRPPSEHRDVGGVELQLSLLAQKNLGHDDQVALRVGGQTAQKCLARECIVCSLKHIPRYLARLQLADVVHRVAASLPRAVLLVLDSAHVS